MSPINPASGWEIGEAAHWIGEELKRARIQVLQTKSKFQQARVYCSFGYMSLHEFLYPGYVWNRFPRWLLKLDYHLLGPLTHQLSRALIPLQHRWYRRTYKKALEKFPHLSEAILTGADWPELLKGLSIYGRLPQRMDSGLDSNPADY